MSQTPFVGAPQGAVWGFDPTTNLWLPIGASPEIIGPTGEIYGSLLTYITNANNNGPNVMANSQSITIASDQPGLTQLANVDGLTPANVLAIVNHLSSGSGTLDSTGKPRQASLDRMTSWQGKGVAGSTANITATVAGDTNLVFGSAPKTIMPGQKIQLAVGSGVSIETAIVSSAYVPSSTATTIPLQYPIVNANLTTAKWDIYAVNGPGLASMLPTDLPITMLAAFNNSSVLPITLVSAYGDGLAPSTTLAVSPALFNGSGSDRQRNNTDVTLLASAARTTTQTSADIVNYNGRGIKVILDDTVPGTGSITVTINGKDPASGKYYLILSGAAVTTVTTNVYTIYPGAAVAANVSANDVLPRTFQIVITANNANSVTYSCGYSIIL